MRLARDAFFNFSDDLTDFIHVAGQHMFGELVEKRGRLGMKHLQKRAYVVLLHSNPVEVPLSMLVRKGL